MRERWFVIGLLSLALAGVMSAGAAEESEPPPTGPAGWIRVDGQDHDLDEMLSLLRPPGAETLALFAPPQSWKPFYDKIYGQDPIDLALYAAVYRLSPGGPDPPSLGDWPSFYLKPEDETADPYQPAPAAASPPGELLDQPSPEAVTFKTTLAPAGENEPQEADDGTRTVYTVIASLVSTPGQIFFLNLFQTDLDDLAELEYLALTWRADFLAARTQEEEAQSEETLE